MNPTDTILDLSKTTDVAMVSSPEWYRSLVASVNELVVHDFSVLVQILYRLDVDENKIRHALESKPGTDAAELIAQLLLERQLQKIKTRGMFSSSQQPTDEDGW